MDITMIEREYPGRIVERLVLEQRGFQIIFEVPPRRQVTIKVFMCVCETNLEAMVHLQEMTLSGMVRSEIEHIYREGEEKDISRFLLDFLLLCVGTFEKQTYADSLVEKVTECLERGRPDEKPL